MSSQNHPLPHHHSPLPLRRRHWRGRVPLDVKVWPRLNNLQYHRAWTVCRMQLPLSKQSVVLVQLPIRHSPIQQAPQRLHLLFRWLYRPKVTDQRDSDRVRVIIRRMQTSYVPSSALEHHSIPTNQEIKSNILMISRRVLGLDLLQDSGTVELK